MFLYISRIKKRGIELISSSNRVAYLPGGNGGGSAPSLSSLLDSVGSDAIDAEASVLDKDTSMGGAIFILRAGGTSTRSDSPLTRGLVDR